MSYSSQGAEYARASLPALLVACALTLAATLCAIALGPGEEGYFDSAFYLDGARHLAHGNGFVCALTQPESSALGPITRWAPGFSLLIAAGIALGLTPLSAASAVLGASYVLAVLCVFVLGLQLAGKRAWLWSLTAALSFAVSPSVLAAMNSLLSDLPFATVALLGVGLALRLCSGRPASFMLRGAFGAALVGMVLMRYAGAFFAAGALLAVALCMPHASLWSRARSLWPSAAIFVAGLAGWVGRNRYVDTEPFGARTFERTDPWLQLDRALGGALTWPKELLQLADATGAATAANVLLGAAALSLPVLLWRSSTHTRRQVALLTLPVLTYFALMVATASAMHFDPIGSPRFWLPVSALGQLLALSLAVRSQGRLARWLRWLPILSMLCAIGLFARDLEQARATAHQARGLLQPRWQAAAAALPDARACHLFISDARPFMLHRELGPTSQIPLTLAELESALSTHERSCIAVVSKRLRLSSTAERRRGAQDEVIAALQREGRLDQLANEAGITLFRVRRGVEGVRSDN